MIIIENVLSTVCTIACVYGIIYTISPFYIHIHIHISTCYICKHLIYKHILAYAMYVMKGYDIISLGYHNVMTLYHYNVMML